MADPRDKRAAEILDSIRQILFHDWNPYCVDKNPNLEDEYDCFISPVYQILTGSRSEEELIDFLFSESKGIREKLRPIAKKLLALNVKL
ncbi:MAG: hypothetical protein JW749_05140 [Sedimentisphaerales bacterium]|nr:hypothetical protein [Sedimentisphaerales bacterium]